MLLTFAIILSVLLQVTAAHADEQPSNKWRTEFSEGAKSDGEIVFRVTPKDGALVDVTAAIEDGTGENSVAKHVRDAFWAQLPEGAYHVERDDGEDVLVKRRGDTPVFSLQLISNSVKAVRIDIEREQARPVRNPRARLTRRAGWPSIPARPGVLLSPPGR